MIRWVALIRASLVGFCIAAPNTAEEFAAAIRSDMEQTARLVKAARIQPE